MDHKLTVEEILVKRIFPGVIGLPKRLEIYYRRRTKTAAIPNGREHQLTYAY